MTTSLTWLRTQMMWALPYLPWKGLVTNQILEPLKRAANAITLKDYQADAPGSPDRAIVRLASADLPYVASD
jgi:hypothetical protein